MATLCISHTDRPRQAGDKHKMSPAPFPQEKETEKREIGFSHWIRLRKGSQESHPQDQGVGMICWKCLFHYKSSHRAGVWLSRWESTCIESPSKVLGVAQ